MGKAKGRQLLGIIDNKFYRIVLIEVLGNGNLSLTFCPDVVPRTCDILSEPKYDGPTKSTGVAI